MATTRRPNLIIPEILTEAIQGAFAGARVLSGTAAAVVNWSMPTTNASGAPIRGGDTIKIPYFGNLGELDEILLEGDALTPQNISMTSESATVRHAGKAIEFTAWAEWAASYADPYEEAARQFKEMVLRYADKALLDVATASGLPASNVVNVANPSGTPKLLDWDTMVDARMAWGDEQANIELVTVHSDVMRNMMKQKDAAGRPLLIQPTDSQIAKYAGVPVAVSDRNTKDTSNALPIYTSVVAKRAALAFWAQDNPEPQTARDILADTELTAIHLYCVAHRYSRMPGGTKPGIVQIKTNG